MSTFFGLFKGPIHRSETEVIIETLKSEKKPDYIDLTELNEGMIGRKARGKNAKSYVIYPDDKLKMYWDSITTV